MPLTLEFIRDEHRNIARVLKALENMARDDAALAKEADSDLFASMLYYLRVFPYAVHHPKEERHLFPAAAKDSSARAAVAALHKEHAEGYALLQQIESAAADAGVPEGLARLKRAILDYVVHEFRHMEREEKEILPVVERTLDAESIAAMRRTFGAHADPVFSENIQAGFEALYRHIKAKIETRGF